MNDMKTESFQVFGVDPGEANDKHSDRQVHIIL